MTAKEALEYMKQDEMDHEVEGAGLSGWFCVIGNRVHFACSGEYPCCHDDCSFDEFLTEYADDNFEKV